MQVAATVILVPLHNPVELAESIATLDCITNGKFVFGVGLGYRDEEYTAFGVQRGERVGRMNEAMDLIKKLWSEDEVEFNGKYYTVPKTKISTRPVQNPHPPIWVAANNDVAIRRAARWGYPWLINPHATVPMVADQWVRYKAALEEFGNPVPDELPMMREMYVARDRETAFIESQPFLEGKYKAYADWGQDKALPGEESFSVPYQDLAKDRFLLGSPDDIVTEFRRYSDELGVNHMICRMQWPGMPQEQVLKQIELLGREVIPRINDF
jgi:alkanesulfonate monooxygenase SsuD/methylene tetrahydromethanopterin reductase-like flavin-dependent oxidoreductase (luciferase family)